MNQFNYLIQMLDHYDIKNASDAREVREIVALQES